VSSVFQPHYLPKLFFLKIMGFSLGGLVGQIATSVPIIGPIVGPVVGPIVGPLIDSAVNGGNPPAQSNVGPK
jgi:hypothetical protein